MERIGIAASKMAKGNLLKYNLCVIAISMLCSVLLFFVCGLALVLALFLISLILRFLLPPEFNSAWVPIAKVSLIGLGTVVGLVTLFAIVKNLKLKKKKS